MTNTDQTTDTDATLRCYEVDTVDQLRELGTVYCDAVSDRDAFHASDITMDTIIKGPPHYLLGHSAEATDTSRIVDDLICLCGSNFELLTPLEKALFQSLCHTSAACMHALREIEENHAMLNMVLTSIKAGAEIKVTELDKEKMN